MMQNAVNESFWDAHGVEIGACTIFDHFDGSGKIYGTGKKMTDSMLAADGLPVLVLSCRESRAANPGLCTPMLPGIDPVR